jgi:MFS family permease
MQQYFRENQFPKAPMSDVLFPSGSRADRWPVCVVALTLFLITSAVNLQAPLYTTYARASHLGAGAQTIAFACYVAGLVPTLIFLGGISDRFGRKWPLAIALLLTTVATAVPMNWPRLEALAAARILCGIATGLMAGSGTQFLVELLGCRSAASTRAAVIVAASTSLGFGSGALATGLCLLAAPSQHTPISYGAYIGCAVSGMVLLAMIRESSFSRSSSWLRMPVFVNGTLPYGIAIFIAWSASGMVIGLVPAALSSHGHDAWTGFATFFVIATGLVAQPMARKLSPTGSLRIGMLLVPCGLTVLIAGVVRQSLPVLLIGAMLVGAASYGFTYCAGLAANTANANDTNRARATSGYFLFAYSGFSVPVVASGLMADRIGVNWTLWFFDGWIVIATAMLALSMMACWRQTMPASASAVAVPEN